MEDGGLERHRSDGDDEAARRKRSPTCFVLAAIVVMFTGCASTRFETSSEPQEPLCDAQASALVLWGTAWRPNQKDVPQREAAARRGIEAFFARSGCYRHATVERVAGVPRVPSALAERVVLITVRELGPVVKLGLPMLLEGGTEVVLTLTEVLPSGRETSWDAHWQNGGPFVVKGVVSLPQDMEAALRACFRPTG